MFYRGIFVTRHLKPYSFQNAPLLTLFMREEISRLSNSDNKRQNTKCFFAACDLIQTLLITRAYGDSCIRPPTMNFLFSVLLAVALRKKIWRKLNGAGIRLGI